MRDPPPSEATGCTPEYGASWVQLWVLRGKIDGSASRFFRTREKWAGPLCHPQSSSVIASHRRDSFCRLW